MFYLGTTASSQFTVVGGLGTNFDELSPDHATLLFKVGLLLLGELCPLTIALIGVLHRNSAEYRCHVLCKSVYSLPY